MELPIEARQAQKVVGLLNYLTEVDHKKISERVKELSKDILERTSSFRPMPKEVIERQILLACIDDLSWLSISLDHQEEMIEMHQGISRCVLAFYAVWLKSQITFYPGKRPEDIGDDGSLVKAFMETSKYYSKVKSFDQCYKQLFDLLTVEHISTIAKVLKEEGL